MQTHPNLKGQWALITGASAGIGRACALTLAGAGVNVYLTGRKELELKAVQSECQSHGVQAPYMSGDLGDRSFIKELVGHCRADEEKRFGTFDFYHLSCCSQCEHALGGLRCNQACFICTGKRFQVGDEKRSDQSH